MKNKYKLLLSLSFLLSIHSSVYAYEEEFVGAEIQNEIKEIESDQQDFEQKELVIFIDKVQQQIDQELYDLFERFFDEHDPMSFSKFVSKVIDLLKLKRSSLHGHQQVKCDELIRIFEKNKHNSNFRDWAEILMTPDLLDLMSEETRSYIFSVSTHVKIKTLICKLKNNK